MVNDAGCICSFLFQFLREFAVAWKWTISEKKGMFASPAKMKWNEKPLPVNIKPHILMIKVRFHRADYFWSTSVCETLCDCVTD